MSADFASVLSIEHFKNSFSTVSKVEETDFKVPESNWQVLKAVCQSIVFSAVPFFVLCRRGASQ
jgi:hypothetical protein